MNVELLRWVLAAHAFATLFMTGLIWFVQVVHYPLFERVGKAEFAGYERQNTRRTGWVVGGPMLLELALALLLVWSPGGLMAWGGLGLLGIVWLSTAVGQMPAHFRLEQGFDAQAYRRLVRGNWIRTVCWTLRGVLATVMLATF